MASDEDDALGLGFLFGNVGQDGEGDVGADGVLDKVRMFVCAACLARQLRRCASSPSLTPVSCACVCWIPGGVAAVGQLYQATGGGV
jgi:hypothetical protein